MPNLAHQNDVQIDRVHSDAICEEIGERLSVALALQLLFWDVSESMGNHDSEVVDASSVD